MRQTRSVHLKRGDVPADSGRAALEWESGRVVCAVLWTFARGWGVRVNLTKGGSKSSQQLKLTAGIVSFRHCAFAFRGAHTTMQPSRATPGASSIVLCVVGVIVGVLPWRVQAHGSLVHPRPRNSIDYLVGVNTQWCANITGDKCENG